MDGKDDCMTGWMHRLLPSGSDQKCLQLFPKKKLGNKKFLFINHNPCIYGPSAAGEY